MQLYNEQNQGLYQPLDFYFCLIYSDCVFLWWIPKDPNTDTDLLHVHSSHKYFTSYLIFCLSCFYPPWLLKFILLHPLLLLSPLEESLGWFFTLWTKQRDSPAGSIDFFPKALSLSAIFSTKVSKVRSLNLSLACKDSS